MLVLIAPIEETVLPSIVSGITTFTSVPLYFVILAESVPTSSYSHTETSAGSSVPKTLNSAAQIKLLGSPSFFVEPLTVIFIILQGLGSAISTE